MKRTLLSVAISLAAFSQASQAATYDVYLAGSSAQDNLVATEIYNLFSGNLTEYLDNANAATVTSANTGSWGSNYKVYSGTVVTGAPIITAVPSLAAGDVVNFHKVNFGGSAQGVAPLFNGTGVDTLNITNSNCLQVGFSAKLPNGTLVPTYGCTTTNTGDLQPQILDGGLSDVDPLLFQGDNTAQFVDLTNKLVSFAPVTSIPAGFTVVPGVSLTWGFPVTYNLYVALQAAQGLISGFGGTCTPGDNANEACIPSLNKSTIASLISGKITNWSKLYFNGVQLTSVAATYDAIAANTAITGKITPTNTIVNFCQRLPGSGTAAAQYAYFLNQPANKNTTVLPALNTVDHIFIVPDGGNMEKCLTDLTAAQATAKDIYGGLVKNTGAPKTAGVANKGQATAYIGWGFGQQSTDKNVPNATTGAYGNAYRFIKINGVAPTLAHVYTGDYDFTNESTWQYPTTPNNTVAGQAVAALVSYAQDPIRIYTDLGQYSWQAFGLAGFQGTFANTKAIDSAYALPTTFASPAKGTAAASLPTAYEAYPVNPWTHAVGTALDNGAFQILNGSAPLAP